MIELEPRRLYQALRDVDYPATKEGLLAAAQRNAPGDEEVLKVLRSLPPVTYANGNEVIRSAPRLRTPGTTPPWPRDPRQGGGPG